MAAVKNFVRSKKFKQSKKIDEKQTAPVGSYKKINKVFFLRWRWCVGINEISRFTGYPLGDISEFIRYWIGFPAMKTVDGIWVAKKSALRRWIKKRNPPKTRLDDIPSIQKLKKFKKRRFWYGSK